MPEAVAKVAVSAARYWVDRPYDYLIPFVSGSQQGHEHEYVKDRKYPQYQQHKYQKCGRGKHGYSPFCKMSNVLYIFMITVYFKNVKRFLHF